MGLLTPWSHVPNTLVTYDDNMTFTERCYNSMLSLCDWIVRKFIYFPQQNELARKYFGHLGSIPSVEDLTQNVSLVLLNTHRSVQSPRPSMPTILNIGGAHIKPPKALPSDLQTFLDEAENGVIYFSLGTVLKTSQMPKEKLQIILGKIWIEKRSKNDNNTFLNFRCVENVQAKSDMEVWRWQSSCRSSAIECISSQMVAAKWYFGTQKCPIIYFTCWNVF